jgi:hypothetical protein
MAQQTKARNFMNKWSNFPRMGMKKRKTADSQQRNLPRRITRHPEAAEPLAIARDSQRRTYAFHSSPQSGHQRIGHSRVGIFGFHPRRLGLRYVHRNPVTRGSVTAPEQWNWSSFRAHAFGEIGAVRINKRQVLKMKIRAG